MRGGVPARVSASPGGSGLGLGQKAAQQLPSALSDAVREILSAAPEDARGVAAGRLWRLQGGEKKDVLALAELQRVGGEVRG